MAFYYFQTGRHYDKTYFSYFSQPEHMFNLIGYLITAILVLINFLRIFPMQYQRFPNYINRGSYMSAHVLLNLLNELGKRDKMRGLPSILSLFRNEFNKFNNTRARVLDSIYHMT